MTIEDYERKRQEHAAKVQARINPPPQGTVGGRPPASEPLVRCVDRPEWGALAARDAAKRVGVPPHHIRKAARENWKCGGLRWHLDGRPYAPRRDPHAGRRVECVETGDVFLSMYAAVRWLEKAVGRPFYHSAVHHAVRNGKPIGGYHFRRVEENDGQAVA